MSRGQGPWSVQFYNPRSGEDEQSLHTSESSVVARLLRLDFKARVHDADGRDVTASFKRKGKRKAPSLLSALDTGLAMNTQRRQSKKARSFIGPLLPGQTRSRRGKKTAGYCSKCRGPHVYKHGRA